MRTFTDAAGVEWTVFEVKRQSRDDGQWNYLPHGFVNGWLCFESDTVKRRLTPVPAAWRGLARAELEQLLWKATVVVRHQWDAPNVPNAEKPDSGDDAGSLD